MNAEIVAVSERFADQVGQGANTHLQAGAVRDQVGNSASDRLVLWGGSAHRQFDYRHMVFDDRIHFRDMQLRAFTKNARHVLVDLDNEPFGAACNLRRIIVASAEAHKRGAFHRRDGADERVDTDVLGEQPYRLMKVRRYVTDHLAAAVLHATLDE